jgi:hypothetical protein
MSTIPYGQAYKRNQGEGLGIELIIELTMWDSKYRQQAFVIVGNLYWHVSSNKIFQVCHTGGMAS